ncbi:MULTISPECIES: hypothetical protein [unclassified Streptomyces]|uniref:hypothetical protein n=1 Tax=unclassified Streptomyces TaxID=2593676 RepID=UPI000DACEF4C|nr:MULTISPECIES: hypothetical protein [unclassified Streptomyces]PZT71742.1 hypothetical protein DNK55_31895 [Streptomyces sp. AC1-42T]PZT73132.1 hypothetical protein DNK56_33180 [Streptomyces sp. AC1-42W]
MVSTENELRQGPTRARRTEGDRKRRRALADHSAGHVPGEGDIPTESRVDRFRVVIYLCGAPNSDISGPRRECEEYAAVFGWEIMGVIEDRVGLLPPDGREGLTQALAHVESKQAGAVLTAWRSMISTIPQEYDEVAREVESRGGFLHVMDTDRHRGRRAERC